MRTIKEYRYIQSGTFFLLSAVLWFAPFLALPAFSNVGLAAVLFAIPLFVSWILATAFMVVALIELISALRTQSNLSDISGKYKRNTIGVLVFTALFFMLD